MRSIPPLWRGVGLYLCAALLWSVNGSVSKTLLESGIEVARLSQLRVSGAFLLFALVVTLRDRGAWRIRSRGELALLVLYGVVGLAVTQWLYFLAIWLLPIGVGLVLEFTAPFLVALWARHVQKQPMPRRVWLGLAIALAGLALITEAWSGFTLDPLGVAAGLGAALTFALYFITGERALHGPPGRDSLSLSMWGFAFGTLFWSLFAPWPEFEWHYLQGTSELVGGWLLPNWSLAGFMVVAGTALPFWLVVSAMRHISAAQASGIGMTEPVMASIIAYLWLGERLSSWQVLGGALTLGGVGLAEAARRTANGVSGAH